MFDFVLHRGFKLYVNYYFYLLHQIPTGRLKSEKTIRNPWKKGKTSVAILPF